MSRSGRRRTISLFLAAAAVLSAGESAEPSQPQNTPPPAGASTESPGREPHVWRWFRYTGSIGARAESLGGAADSGDRDRYVTQRFRLDLLAEPSPLIRAGVSAHDARAFALRAADGLDGAAYSLDVAQAWIEFGNREGSGWRARAGRQELSFGDERLIGADSEWSNIGRSFDAVRVSFQTSRTGLDVFAAAPVLSAYGRWNRRHPSERLQGLNASFRIPSGILEAFTFRTTDGASSVRRETFGVHLRGDLGRGFDHNAEVAIQRGKISQERVRGWSGHWELGKRLGRADSAPRVSVEYNYASGDSDASDGVYGTFNDLYAASYNRYGMADPFAARNLQNAEAALEYPIGKRLRATAGLRAYWVVSLTDGVYAGPDVAMMTAGRGSGHHLADQINVSVTYRAVGRVQISAGYGQLLRRSAYVAAGVQNCLTNVFVAASRSF